VKRRKLHESRISKFLGYRDPTLSTIYTASWKGERGMVAKVEWYAGELVPRVGFIVTNLRWWSKKVVKLYNGRGTAKRRERRWGPARERESP
jgi:hypothetical protein